MNQNNNLLEKFLQYHADRGHSYRTIQTYKEILTPFLKNIDPLIANYPELREYLEKFQGLSINTLNQKRACIKSFFRWLVLDEYRTNNPSDKLFMIKNNNVGIVKFIKEEDFKKIIARTKPRDKIMFSLGYLCGLRLSEILNLRKEHIHQDIKSLEIHGKGNKVRYIPVPDTLWPDFLAFSSQLPATCSQLFLTRLGTPMTKSAFYSIWYSRMRRLGLNYNPHALRHGCATRYLLKGANVREIQELLGHSSIKTTQKYTHIVSEKLRELVNKET